MAHVGLKLLFCFLLGILQTLGQTKFAESPINQVGLRSDPANPSPLNQVTITCRSNIDGDEVTWKYMDGNEEATIARGDRFATAYRGNERFKFDGPSRLTISSLEPNDAGTYKCEGFEIEQNTFASVIILDAEPECSLSAASYTEDMEIQVTCTMSYSGPWGPQVSFETSDGTPLTDMVDSSRPGGMMIMLQLPAGREHDGLQIKATVSFPEPPPAHVATSATNEFRATNAPEYSKTIDLPPVVVHWGPENVRISRHGNRLTCQAESSPAPAFAWTDDTLNELGDGAEIEITDPSVAFNFTCTAQNPETLSSETVDYEYVPGQEPEPEPSPAAGTDDADSGCGPHCEECIIENYEDATKSFRCEECEDGYEPVEGGTCQEAVSGEEGSSPTTIIIIIVVVAILLIIVVIVVVLYKKNLACFAKKYSVDEEAAKADVAYSEVKKEEDGDHKANNSPSKDKGNDEEKAPLTENKEEDTVKNEDEIKKEPVDNKEETKEEKPEDQEDKKEDKEEEKPEDKSEEKTEEKPDENEDAKEPQYAKLDLDQPNSDTPIRKEEPVHYAEIKT